MQKCFLTVAGTLCCRRRRISLQHRESWRKPVSLVWSGNKTTEPGRGCNNKNKPKTVPSALKIIHTVLGCWRTHESRVVPQWKIFRRSRNFVVPCVTNVLGGKKNKKKTIILLDDSARPIAVRLCMDRIRMKPWNLSTIHPTGLTLPSYCRQFGFVKDQMRGKYYAKRTAETGFCCKGDVKTSRVVANIHRLGLWIL